MMCFIEHYWRVAQQPNCNWRTAWAGIQSWWTGMLLHDVVCYWVTSSNFVLPLSVHSLWRYDVICCL